MYLMPATFETAVHYVEVEFNSIFIIANFDLAFNLSLTISF